MRLVLITAGLFLGSVGMAAAQAPDAGALPPPGAQYDVPAGSKPQTITVGRYVLPPGKTNPVRMHPGVEMTCVAQGDLEFWVAGKPPHVYHAGDVLVIPRGEQYQVKVVSAVPVILYATLVVDQGVPPAPIVPGLSLIH